MKSKLISFFLMTCFLTISFNCKCQADVDLLNKLQKEQYSLIYNDVLKDITNNNKLKIKDSTEIFIESFQCNLNFVSGGRIMLFRSSNTKNEKVKKKMLKKYYMFLNEIRNNKRIPSEMVRDFTIECEIYANTQRLYKSTYMLKYDSDMLIIADKKVFD